jgi:hypothetical protein
MVDYKRFGFVLKVFVNLFALKYIFVDDSKNIVDSANIIVGVNFTNLILDFGLSSDQLSIFYGLKRLCKGINHIFWIGIMVIIPISIIFKIPLYFGIFVAVSGIFRNYFIKKGEQNILFILDLTSSICMVLLFGLIELLNFDPPYYIIVFFAAIVESIILSPLFIKILIFKPMFPTISLNNYIAKIIDVGMTSLDILVINMFFDSIVASSYFKLKEIYRKACQFFSIAILRLLYDKLEFLVKHNLTIYLLFFSIVLGLLEYILYDSLFLSIVIIALILTLTINYLMVFQSLKKYNIDSIIVYVTFLLVILFLGESPEVFLFLSLFILTTLQLYEIRKVYY